MKSSALRSLIAILIAMPAICHATGQMDFSGTWALRVDARNLFVLTLTPQGSELRGSWEHPALYTAKGPGEVQGGAFSNLRGGILRDLVVSSRFDGETLHLAVQSEKNPQETATLAMTVNGDKANFKFEPATNTTFPFVRVAAGAHAATDWEPNRLYTASDSEVPSDEMKAVFDEDQRVRHLKDADWSAVRKTDAERRVRTRALPAAGALHTGKDYEEAAFIFQHGDSTDDYLLAHTLAIVAVSKGDSTAIWIAAATLDRYLQRIGQKQIYGTQFKRDPQEGWTHEPYDCELVSDVLRQQLLESTLAAQEEYLKSLPTPK